MKSVKPELTEKAYLSKFFEIEKDTIKATNGIRGNLFENFNSKLINGFVQWCPQIKLEEQIAPKKNEEFEILDKRLTLGCNVYIIYEQVSLTGGGAQGNRSRKYTDINFQKKALAEYSGDFYINLVVDSPINYGKTEKASGRKLLKLGIETKTLFWPSDLVNLLSKYQYQTGEK